MAWAGRCFCCVQWIHGDASFQKRESGGWTLAWCCFESLSTIWTLGKIITYRAGFYCKGGLVVGVGPRVGLCSCDEGGTICVVLCDCRAVARFRHCLLRSCFDAEQAWNENGVYLATCATMN